ncbi:MAG: ATP synthase F1 subunit delta [Saprospirales bacterium]|nr:ATP synthase F1 subunit delta [Saprospirales bacterium]MBK8922140.1 ATP synthase F1 subunit delta [Saprospirales bacterium]
MSVTRIATRYAKSLLELAISQNKLEAVYADINALKSATTHRDLYMLLKSPIVHADKKMAVLNAIFQGRIDGLTLAYLDLLVNKGREMYLPEIAVEFVHQYKTLKRITTVRVTSATPLSEAVLNDLRKKLLLSGVTTENLDVDVQVNPKLIGGFVLEFDNKRYDASAANKLAELKADFLKNQYIKEF